MQNGIIKYMGVKLLSALDEASGIVYVAMKPIIEGMGLDLNSQLVKMKQDSRFNYGVIPMVAEDGKSRKMGVLALDHLPAFLYSINPNKVRKDLRETIIAFQNETFTVINEYWKRKQTISKRQAISGYKSQIVQHNKKIIFLEGQVATLKKMQPQTKEQDVPQEILKLIEKGLKYDKLSQDYIKQYEKLKDLQAEVNKIMYAMGAIKQLQLV